MGTPDDIESRVTPPGTIEEVPSKPTIEVGREHLHSAIPPHDTYEGRHRFDPQATWSPQDEKRVVRKTDLRLLSWLCIMVKSS